MTSKLLVSCAAALVLIAGSCASADDDSASDVAEDVGAPETTIPAGGAGAGSSGGDSGEGGVTALPDLDLVAAQVDRKIVYTGEVTSEVDELLPATRSARDAVAAEGGFVFAEEVGQRSARVVLKVPSVRFDAAFDAVAAIGEVSDRRLAADDVTERFVDLESRLATLETSVDRLRGFLAQAGNVDEISRLESELTRREAEHDVIAGQLRVLRDRTALATITVTFTVADDALGALHEQDEGVPPGFRRGLEVGWDAVVAVAGVVATSAGFALPFVPLLALAVAALWWQRRRATPVA